MKTTIKEHFVDFGKTTSVKGVGMAIKSDRKVLKVVWFMAFLTGMSVAVYQLYQLCHHFFGYSVVAQISTNNAHPPFPDVTFCNINHMELISDLDEGLEILHNYRDTIEKLRNNITEMEMRKNDVHIKYIDRVYKKLRSTTAYFANVGYEKKLLEDAAKANIVHCHWYDWEGNDYSYRENCSKNSVYSFISEKYFLCTTLHVNNSNMMSDKTEVKMVHGMLFLNDFLNYHLPEININTFDKGGIRVVVHPYNTLPDISTGFDAPTGHQIDIVLKPKKIERKGSPYSDCIDSKPLESDTNISYNTIRYTYTDGAATNLCKQEYYVKKCNCFHPHYPIIQTLIQKYPGVTNCEKIPGLKIQPPTFDIKDVDPVDAFERVACYMSIHQHNIDEELDQTCTAPDVCNSYTYDFQTHAISWPHPTCQLALYKDFINNTPYANRFERYGEIYELHKIDAAEAHKQLKNIDLIERNFLKIKVRFHDSTLVTYTEVAKLTMESFFGTMGGVFNLWTGITFFTLIEFFDFFYHLISDICNYKKKKDQMKGDLVQGKGDLVQGNGNLAHDPQQMG